MQLLTSMHPLPQRRNWQPSSPEYRSAYVTCVPAQPAQPRRRWDWQLIFDEVRYLSDLTSFARRNDAARHGASTPPSVRMPAATLERRGNEA